MTAPESVRPVYPTTWLPASPWACSLTLPTRHPRAVTDGDAPEPVMPALAGRAG